MKIGYIGSGPISNFHIPAIQSNDINIVAIGSKNKSQRCYEIAKKFDLTSAYCPEGWEEVINKEVDGYCICIDTSHTQKILEKCLKKNKPILVEKPITWKYSELNKLESKFLSNVFVAYNRRFYNVVQTLKKKCDSLKGGTINVNIPDSISGIRQFIVNGCHMVDLLRYVAGDFEIIAKSINFSQEKKDLNYFSALCKNNKWIISLNAHSCIPANFSLTVNSGEEVFELKPIEQINFYRGLRILEPTAEVPIRKYIPNIIDSQIESTVLKPGFDLMYRNFKQFLNCGSSDIYCSFEDAKKTLKTCWDLIDSNETSNFTEFDK